MLRKRSKYIPVSPRSWALTLSKILLWKMKLRGDDGATKSRELEVFEQRKHMILLHMGGDKALLSPLSPLAPTQNPGDNPSPLSIKPCEAQQIVNV